MALMLKVGRLSRYCKEGIWFIITLVDTNAAYLKHGITCQLIP